MRSTIKARTWYVYRSSAYRNVLKHPETVLKLTELENGDRRARLALSGWDDPVEVTMKAHPIGAWLGEKASIDLRWAPIECGGTDSLIGHAADRVGFDHTDFFFAVRSRRTSPTSEQPKIYTFDCSYITPLNQGLPSEPGGRVVVDLRKGKKEIVFKGESYKIKESASYGGGFTLTGFNVEDGMLEGSIWLWILPVDATGHLLATGYLYYMEEMANAIAIDPSRPFDPECKKVIHLCQTC